MPRKSTGPGNHVAQVKVTRAANPGVVCLFLVRDFYEAYGDDAEIVAILLQSTVVIRLGDGLKMIGFPAKLLGEMQVKLKSAGYRTMGFETDHLAACRNKS